MSSPSDEAIVEDVYNRAAEFANAIQRAEEAGLDVRMLVNTPSDSPIGIRQRVNFSVSVQRIYQRETYGKCLITMVSA
ncbi:hypothetical protein AAD018_013850 [Aestuariibius insulae]|uniref:hypothetical protein n=1 Tax=Aestuariibius insulae TaxID=2058287 RepID=UPI00345EBAE9